MTAELDRVPDAMRGVPDLFQEHPIATVSPSEFRTTNDFKMLTSLMNDGAYKIPDRLRAKALDRIEDILDRHANFRAKNSCAVSAIRALAAMDEINLQLLKIAAPKKVEQISVKDMNDDQLLEAVADIQKRLPPVARAQYVNTQ